MSLKKTNRVSESCLDLLAIELINYYSQQSITPPQAAIDAIGMPFYVFAVSSLHTADAKG